MTDARRSFSRETLKTPSAAAFAGILFALLYGAAIILIRLSIPPTPVSENLDWLVANSGRVDLALNLVPFAGIAFLWFIGVIRDRIGDREDRLFATVFLGSGLLFLAMTFAGAALAGGLMTSYVAESQLLVRSGVFAYGRAVMYEVINVFAIRMAGVFMISLGTIWLRTGLMHRAWAFVTYGLALFLLISISLSLWMMLIFPAWVLAVSVYFLIRMWREERAQASAAGPA
jgi:hypothetical protein